MTDNQNMNKILIFWKKNEHWNDSAIKYTYFILINVGRKRHLQKQPI